MGHVREYTPIEIGTFPERIGFEVDELIYRGSYNMKSSWKNVLAGGLLAAAPRFSPFFSLIARKHFSSAGTVSS